MNCTICKGTKETTLTIHTWGETESKTMKIACIHCKGTGSMTQDDIDQLAWEKEQWCKCEEVTSTTYVADNVSPICDKHHWTCDDCFKITQVG